MKKKIEALFDLGNKMVQVKLIGMPLNGAWGTLQVGKLKNGTLVMLELNDDSKWQYAEGWKDFEDEESDEYQVLLSNGLSWNDVD